MQLKELAETILKEDASTNWLKIGQARMLVEEINAIDKMLADIQNKRTARERELLGVALEDCVTEEELNKYSKILDEKGDLLDQDTEMKELRKREKDLIEEINKLFDLFKYVLGKINSLYKEIDVFWLKLKFDEFKRILKVQ